VRSSGDAKFDILSNALCDENPDVVEKSLESDVDDAHGHVIERRSDAWIKPGRFYA
jgi:hypothetical protein